MPMLIRRKAGSAALKPQSSSFAYHGMPLSAFGSYPKSKSSTLHPLAARNKLAAALIAAFSASLLFAPTQDARADNFYWNNTNTGNTESWATPANWDQNSVPSNADDVNISNGGTANIGAGGTREANDLSVGGTSSSALNISGGGKLALSGRSTIGNAANTTGIVTVDGTGSSLTASGVFHVGFNGTGTLNITKGATALTTNLAIIGENTGSNGTVTVDGSGSLLTVQGTFLGVGGYGTGTLNITNGATASVTNGVIIASDNGGNGTVTVGEGSDLSLGGNIYIGHNRTNPSTGTGSLTVKGTLTTTGENLGTYTKDIFNFGTNTLKFEQAGNQTLSGVISGTGDLTKAGTGTLTLSGANTYSGGTTVTGGLINFTNAGNLGTGNITLNGGGLQWATNNTTDISGRLTAIGANGATFHTNDNNLTLATPLTGTGGVTKAGTGTLTLSGVNTYSGGTTVTGGLINFSNENNLGTGNITLNGGGLQWDAGNTADISGRLTAIGANGATFHTNDNNLTLANTLSGTGGITKDGTGWLILSGNNTYTGNTTVSAGTLTVTGSLGNGNYAGNIVNNGVVVFYQTGNQTISGAISGAGNLFLRDAGTLTLSGSNNLTGDMNVNAGTLRLVGNAGTLKGNLHVNADTLDKNVSLEAERLSAPFITITETVLNTAKANIGTLDVSTNNSELKLDATSASNVKIDNVTLGDNTFTVTSANSGGATISNLNVTGTNGILTLDATSASNLNVGTVFLSGNMFTLNRDNSGDFTLGGISVTGTGNRIGIGTNAAPISVNSLTFKMDNTTPVNSQTALLDANNQLATTLTTKTSLTAGTPLSQFAVGDKVTLVSNLAGGSDYTAQTGVAARYGATDYLFDVDMDAATLAATYSGEKAVANEAARGYGYGISARSASLNNAYDSTLNVIHNWRMADPATLSDASVKFDSFAQLSASHTKTKTGSHVDNDGISFTGGAGWELPLSSGSLLLGLFVEGGTGSYDSYNSFARGDGDTWHYGAGGFAKFKLTQGTYFEGSVRAGRTKADFDAKQLHDASYDSTSWYWGAHAGVGH
ncbi:autotransporter-associated beta strand repeat-containing protein, partial [Oxalobacter sp. OttesenSCG-928-P03]|nr:autotransporter-associated beta strand repeat-containing protein [Oxalobacter sp. OttesenSCG-928-P03]